MSNYVKWKELEASISLERTIDKDLRRQLRLEEQRWREVLLRLLKVIRWMAKNNLPFRGSSDTVFTEQNGIFLQLLELISDFDLVLKEHLQRAKEGTNVHYLSKDMQNKFLQLIAEAVIEIIIQKVKQAKFFSIIVDCTPDISKQEQLSLVLRYVEIDKITKTVEVKESFLQFVHVTETTGRSLAEVVVERLTEHGLRVSDIRGQCYDNGANMRGQYKGVQAIILERNSYAFFVPCSPHNWNLVIVHAAESSSQAKRFYDILNRLYTFFSGATKRWEVATEHLSQLTLKALSQTRWCARLQSVKAVLLQFPQLVEALEEFVHGTKYSSDTYSEAKILLDCICSYPFVVSLCVWYDVLLQVNQISLAVQTKTIDLADALPLVESVTASFKEYLSSGFKEAESKAAGICEKLDIPIEYPTHRIRKRTRQCSDKDCQEPACKQASVSSFSDTRTEFEETFFKPLLNTVLQEIDTRFNFLKQFTAKFGFLTDLKKSASDVSVLEQHCLNFSDPAVDGEDMLEECKTLARMLSDHLCPQETLQYIVSHSLHLTFPNLLLALQLLLTVPVSVASAERSFSKLKLIKNYLRSQMSQDRLNALAVLSIEAEEAECVDFNDVIHRFASEKTRRKV
ncbi:zinc finger MYM-type protein 1-like [Dendropsophus ebraccatus]|uniref:zinc finger MYM-type protein 1-like n=1 Tax=Dendropsophus ebraccatus TaxID=150705 RepID=UPI00383177DE